MVNILVVGRSCQGVGRGGGVKEEEEEEGEAAMAEGCSGGKEESKSATVVERHSRRHGGFSDVVKPSMRAKRHRRLRMNSPNGVRMRPKIFNLPSKQAKETRLIWKQQSKRRAQAVMHRKRRLTMLVPP